MQRYPLNRIALQMVLGLVAGIFLAPSIGTGRLWLLFVFLLLLIIAWLSFRTRALGRVLLIGCALFGGCVLFWQSSQGPAGLVPYTAEQTPREVTGRIELAPEGKTWLHLRVTHVDGEPLKKPGVIRIMRVYGDEGDYARASTVAFTGELIQPEPPRNPGGFDEKRYLFSKGIYTKMKVGSPGITLAPPSPLQNKVNRWQSDIDAVLERHTSEEQHHLIRAVLFGETDGLHKDFYSLSQRFGIIHIFSVSGLHVGFIVGFLLGVAYLFRRQNSWGVFIFLLPILGVYLVLSGMSPPGMRAGLMAILGFLALHLLRHKDLLTIIALAAAILLSADPHLLWDIGFQLSFIITAGIVYGYGAVQGALPALLPPPVRAALGLSLTAELVSAPLVAWYFYILAPFSILMNVIVVPLFSVMVPLALLAIALAALLPFLGPLFFFPVQVILYTVVALMRFFEAFFGSGHVYVGQPPLWLLLLYGASLLFFFSGRWLPDQPFRWRSFALLILIGSLATFRTPLPGNQLLTVLDVGQGSSAVAQSSDGKWLVFDTGAPRDTTAQFMRYAAANRLEAVVLSHGDSDHINGLRHLLRDFQVQHLFVTPDIQDAEEWENVAPLVHRKKVQVHVVEEGLEVEVGRNIRLNLQTCEDIGATDNQVQLLAAMMVDSHRIVFPGDASAEMLRAYTPFSPTDVVLLPHHGSKNSWSAAFYDALQPSLAVASCGKDNRYGHPHGVVEEGLAERGIALVRTDQEGAVLFFTAGDTLFYDSFLSQQREENLER